MLRHYSLCRAHGEKEEVEEEGGRGSMGFLWGQTWWWWTDVVNVLLFIHPRSLGWSLEQEQEGEAERSPGVGVEAKTEETNGAWEVEEEEVVKGCLFH